MTSSSAARQRAKRTVAKALLTALLASVAAVAVASSVVARSPAQLFGTADRVVYGIVDDVTRDAAGTTTVTLRIERDLGAIDGSDVQDVNDPTDVGSPADDRSGQSATLQLIFGGAARAGFVADLPVPAVGDRVLWAIDDREDATSPIVGFWQGAWTVTARGLEDLRGRVLGLDAGVVAVGGAERSIDAVLAAVAEALATDGVGLGTDVAIVPDANGLPQVPDAPSEDGNDEGEGASSSADRPYVLALAVPDTAGLRSSFTAAAELWRAAGLALDVTFDDDAADRVTVAEARELDPDVRVLLRVVRGRPGTELLLAPGSSGRNPTALAQALGRLLGLPPARSGFASGLLPADVASAAGLVPSSGEVDELRRRLASLPGDLDADGDVDLYDLAAVAAAFGSEGASLPADLDRSGVVDRGDLDLLREVYDFLPASRDGPAPVATDRTDDASDPSADPEASP